MKLVSKEHEKFFEILNTDDMIDFLRIGSHEEYRGRGSTFYHTDIIEVKPEHKGHFPNIDIAPYLGIWRTNQYITDIEYGTVGDCIYSLIYSLIKVIRTEVPEIKIVWEEVL